MAICFAFVPQRYSDKTRIQAEPPACWRDRVLFTDAAPTSPTTFTVGVYLPVGGIRTFPCP